MMFDTNCPAYGPLRVWFGKVKRSPIAKLIFVVCPEIYLIGIPVGIDFKQLLVVVMFSVNKCDKAPAWFGAENLFKEFQF